MEASHIPDMVNSALQVGGTAFTFVNVSKLYRTKCPKGVSFWAISFFVTWGIWQLYFYYGLGQWFSMGASFSMLIANGIYASLVLKYELMHRKERKEFLQRVANKPAFNPARPGDF